VSSNWQEVVMSTGLIVLIIVVVVALVVLALALPRMRERARVRARERELGQPRDAAATEHRQAAQQLAKQADAAEQRARIAEQEAARQRAEAQAQQGRAALHKPGLADRELISDDERERFRGISAVEESDRGGVGAGGFVCFALFSLFEARYRKI
jgi:hypothetical protein